MKKNLFSRLIHLIIFYIICHTLIFSILHFTTPDIGDIRITVVPSEDNPETYYITVSVDSSFDNYYILAYESSTTDHWIYSTPSTYGASSSDILNEFVPQDKHKYILLFGTHHNYSFTFTLKSRHPINYMSSLEHIFHVYYVVPIDIFPSIFYFHKHALFFIDPLS